MSKAKSVVSAKYKRLVIPRPDYEQSGYQSLKGHIIFADGSQFNGNSSASIDYGIKLSDPDILHNNNLTVLVIQQRPGNLYAVPSPNTTEYLDLREQKHLKILNLRSVFLLADNILLPEILEPFESINTNDALAGYNGQNNLTGDLDLTPLNVNGMFGGSIHLAGSISSPLLNDVILPQNVTRSCNISLRLDPSSTRTSDWDFPTWTRLRGLTLVDSNVSSIIFPTFVEPDAEPCSLQFNNGTGLDNTPRAWDLSAMHNLGGSNNLGGIELTSVLFNSNITNEVTNLSLQSNDLTTVDLSGFKNFNGSLYLQNNNLTSVTLPPSTTTTFSVLDIGGESGLNIGVLDLTGYSFNDCYIKLNDTNLQSLIIDNSEKANIGTLILSLNSLISGVFDLTYYTNPSGLEVRANQTNITSVTFSNNILTESFQMRDTLISGIFDMSLTQVQKSSFSLQLSGTNISGIIFPSDVSNGSDRISQLNLNDTLLSNIDFRSTNNYKFLASFNLNISNTPISSIIMPLEGFDYEPSTSNSSRFILQNNNLLSELSIECFMYFYGWFYVNNNNTLTTLLLRSTGYITTSSNRKIRFYIQLNRVLTPIDFSKFSGLNQLALDVKCNDNNWSAAEVNKVLVDIAAIEATHNYGSGSLDISGSNSEPDGTSGGYDGATALNVLVTAGWTVTVSTIIVQSLVLEATTVTTNEVLEIPTSNGGANNYKIAWGDGSVEYVDYEDVNPIHTYSTAGVYEVTIFPQYNTGLPILDYHSIGGSDLLTDVKDWGTNEYSVLNFSGCSNLNISATNVPDLTTNSVSKVNMFNNTSVDIDFVGWDFTYDTDLTGFLTGVKLSDGNYASFLNYLLTQSYSTNLLVADFGDSEISTDQALKDKMDVYLELGWTIIDNGVSSIYLTSKVGTKYVSFDGVNQYGTVDNKSLDNLDEGEVMYNFVVRTTDLGVTTKGVLGKSSLSDLSSSTVFINSSEIRSLVDPRDTPGGNITITSPITTINDNNWHIITTVSNRYIATGSSIPKMAMLIDGKCVGRENHSVIDPSTIDQRSNYISVYGDVTGTSPLTGSYLSADFSFIETGSDVWDLEEGSGSTLTGDNSETITLFNSPTWGTI